ncbi:MAG: signal recognition particle protein [Candidatus Diapherotrites archaeon]|nr:signal recognition particle protein [Candidatus Diapherotrites archaeon]
MPISKFAAGLRNVISKISGAPIIDETLLNQSIRELQRTLIQADVNVKLVLEMTKRIRERVKSEKPPKGLSQKEHFIKIVYDELVSLVGEGHTPDIKPQKILLVGTYGHGKTSTTAKLAKFFSKRGLKTAMITTDTWRPAAYEQLKQLGDKINIPSFGMPEERDPISILKKGLDTFKGFDVIIVDSAGRDSINKELIDEINKIAQVLKPDETYLVIGADMGQTASKQAKQFNDAVGLTGVIITKMDSSAKGGGALSACAEAKVPIVFIGTGEKIDDFEIYNAERYISRLLGYGDLSSLLSKVREIVEEEELSPEEMLKGEFTLKTFYKQLEATRKMGPLSKVLEQLGLSMKISDEDIEKSEEKLRIYKVIIDSMTEEERKNPDIIKKSRIERIAKGSGRKEEEVRELLKQFNLAKKMFSKMKKGKRPPSNLSSLMKRFR